jgi:hypothetical protein
VNTSDATRAADGPRTIDPATWQRIGGVAALLLAAGYVATMPAFALAGAPPTGALARLEYHAGSVGPWWVIVALSVLTDLLFVPVAIALYTALRRWAETTMLVATAFTLLFVALDLAVTWTGYVSLVSLGERYAAATTAEQRVTLVTAAGYPDAVLSSPLIAVYSVLTLGIGILVTSLVVLRSTFGRAVGIVGVATGLLSIASSALIVLTGQFSPLVVAASLLTIAWLLLVGRGLVRNRAHGAAARR